MANENSLLSATEDTCSCDILNPSLLHGTECLIHASVNYATIGINDGSSPVRPLAFSYGSGGLLLIGALRTNFNEIWINILYFSYEKRMNFANVDLLVLVSICSDEIYVYFLWVWINIICIIIFKVNICWQNNLLDNDQFPFEKQAPASSSKLKGLR